ncbi:hypothetical protein RYX36_001085, partial [Vicia faba]
FLCFETLGGQSNLFAGSIKAEIWDIFAFACGELALAQQNQSDAGCYPSQNALSMRAQDGYSYMFAFVFSVVESLVLFLMLRNIRRTVQSIRRIHKSRNLGVSRDGALVSVAPNINQCRMYMQYKFPSEGCSSFMWRRARENFHKGRSFWNLSAISIKNIAAHNPQTWKLLYRIYSSNGSNGFTSINMVAQAVSLALSRSCFLIPSIFAFACGELALAQQNQSDAGCYPSQNALSMRAQDGYSYMFAFVFSVVESLVLLAKSYISNNIILSKHSNGTTC